MISRFPGRKVRARSAANQRALGAKPRALGTTSRTMGSKPRAVGGMPRALGAVALAILTLWGPGSVPAAEPAAQDGLTLAFIPQENPEKLLGDITVISEYLAAEISVPVDGYVTLDHAAAVEALRNRRADISFMGALPYVLAHHHVGAQVLLAEVYRGSPRYRARIFVRRDSGLRTPQDLRGKSIAFADPISESGYLYPLDIFAKAGLHTPGGDPQRFFGSVYFAGGYQQAIQAVANGYADAAGASQFADLLLTPEQLEQVTWIAESEPIPSHAVIARADLDERLVAAFKDAMLKLNDDGYRHLLAHVYGPDGYVETSHEAFVGVETLAREYGYLDE